MKNKFSAGYTIVEMSVVLLIIALIVGGLLFSQDMIRSAKIRRTVSILQQVTIAEQAFEEKYHAMPGDMRNATQFFPDATNGNGNSKYDNSDGSGFAYSTVEGKNAWLELTLAGLYALPARGTDYTIRDLEYGAFPEMPFKNLTMQFYTSLPYNGQDLGWGRAGNVILITDLDIEGGQQWWADWGNLSPRQMHDIDAKMDDGIAFSGDIRAFGTSWGANCTSTVLANGATPTDYDLTRNDHKCVGVYFFQHNEDLRLP